MNIMRRTTEQIYGNCEVISEAGTLLFRCKHRKAKWYLENDLAIKVTDHPLTIQLLFKENGPGWSDDEYHSQIRENKCCCCGSPKELTRHHVVPYCYKVFLCNKFGDNKLFRYAHEFHDILPMCNECHIVYETQYGSKLRDEIAREFDAPMQGRPAPYVDVPKLDAIRAMAALRDHGSKIPEERRRVLESRAETFLGRPPTAEDFELIRNQTAVIFPENRKSHGELVIDQLDDPHDFIVRWRKNFLDNMKPKYMPTGWDVYRQSSSSNTATLLAS